MSDSDVNREISFVAKYYKEGLFNADKTLRKIKPALRKIWTWQKIAAVSCIIVTMGASAAFLIHDYYISEPRQNNIEETAAPIPTSKSISKVIDFDDTPLPIVIEQISLVYGVEISNIPIDAENYRLSLHYEGNASDLIETINEILGINLKINE